MVVKGRYGKFLACPGFPECKNTKPIVTEIGVNCPECSGSIVVRRSKRGRTFYGCSNYPDCKFVSWNKPSNNPCPRCGGFMVTKNYKSGEHEICTNKECGYKSKNSDIEVTPWNVKIIGGGLAGCEAAWHLAESGIKVDFFEMRPSKMTPAHHTGKLAELVCSNSFRSNEITNAAGLLKQEMRIMDSIIIKLLT